MSTETLRNTVVNQMPWTIMNLEKGFRNLSVDDKASHHELPCDAIAYLVDQAVKVYNNRPEYTTRLCTVFTSTPQSIVAVLGGFDYQRIQITDARVYLVGNEVWEATRSLKGEPQHVELQEIKREIFQLLFSLLASPSTENVKKDLTYAQKLISWLITINYYECQRASAKEAQLRLTLEKLNDQTWDVLLSIMAFPSHESVGNDLRKVLDLVINLLNVHRGRSRNSKTEENRLQLGLADVKDAAWESLLFFLSLPSPYGITTDIRPTLDCISELLISYRHRAKTDVVMKRTLKVLGKELATLNEYERAIARVSELTEPKPMDEIPLDIKSDSLIVHCVSSTRMQLNRWLCLQIIHSANAHMVPFYYNSTWVVYYAITISVHNALWTEASIRLPWCYVGGLTK